jgi:hypothetical protein
MYSIHFCVANTYSSKTGAKDWKIGGGCYMLVMIIFFGGSGGAVPVRCPASRLFYLFFVKSREVLRFL